MPTVFLYGPDTFRARVFDRIGTCDVLGSAALDGYELTFDKPNMKNKREGFANVRPADGQTTVGVAFDLSRKQLETLQGYYGGYTATPVKIDSKKHDAKVDATVFVARRRGQNLSPSKTTVDFTARGAEENGLPRDFIEQIRGLKAIDG